MRARQDVYFPDEASRQQFGNLFCNHLIPFWGEGSPSLLDELSLWVHVQLMLNDFWSYVWHVLVTLSEDIEVFFKELDEPCSHLRA